MKAKHKLEAAKRKWSSSSYTRTEERALKLPSLICQNEHGLQALFLNRFCQNMVRTGFLVFLRNVSRSSSTRYGFTDFDVTDHSITLNIVSHDANARCHT